MSKQRVSRRQFLNYTLTGVGGFFGAAMLMPMVRFAVDPVLKVKATGDYIATGTKVADITEEPTRVDFKAEIQDAWYDTTETRTAWVYKDDEGEIIALSPKCKHLGCTVAWNTSDKHPNEFFCPCHGGRYEKSGKNIPKTPPTGPLDIYQQKVKDGILYLGKKEANNV